MPVQYPSGLGEKGAVLFVSNRVKIQNSMDKRARDIVRGSTRRLKAWAKELIRAQKTMPSPPGQAPFSRSGMAGLLGSFKLRTEKKGDEIFGSVESTVRNKSGDNYAKFLEFGTDKMAARPFFRPSAQRMQQWTQERFNEKWLHEDGSPVPVPEIGAD